MAWKMDNIDKKIIEILAENSRIPNKALGKMVGLSEPAARRRVANLELHGVISKFTIEVQAGGRVQAMVFIALRPSASCKKIAHELSKISGIDSILEISGDTDVLVRLSASDMDELNSKIDEIRSHPDVVSTRTNIVLKRWK